VKKRGRLLHPPAKEQVRSTPLYIRGPVKGRPIDLVMWTYNSARTLGLCLDSVEKAVPEEYVHCKIAVDGNSRDETREILKAHGWTVYPAPSSIPGQANKALSLVDTDFYASFEHDIVLNDSWLHELYPKIQGDDKTAVIQGIRVNTGSKLLEALDARYYVDREIPFWYYSIDNNIYRTELIRWAGGYPYADPYSSDGFLRKRLIDMGYKWRVEGNVVSAHLKDSYWRQMRQQVRAYATSKVLWESYSSTSDAKRLLRLIALPIVGGRIAGFAHTPSAFLGYPLMKYAKAMCKGLYLVIHGKQRIVVKIPLD